MRRRELLAWAGLLGLLLLLNLHTATKGGDTVRQGPSVDPPALTVAEHRKAADRLEDAFTRAPPQSPATQRALARSRIYQRDDELRPPPPALPTAQAPVTLPADEADDPAAVARQHSRRTEPPETGPVAGSSAASLLERQLPTWASPRRARECAYINDLYDTVVDSGGDPRSRLITSLVALFAANATGPVADVASMTLHATVGLMVSEAKSVTTITFDRKVYDTGKHLHIEWHRMCGGAGYLGDLAQRIEKTAEPFDVLVVGTLRHAQSVASNVVGGVIKVRQYFIVAQAQPEVAASHVLDFGELLQEMARGRWIAIFVNAEMGIAVFQNPAFNSLLVEALPSRHPTEAADGASNSAAESDHPPATEDPAAAPASTTQKVPEAPASVTNKNDRERFELLQVQLVAAVRTGDKDAADAVHRSLARILSKYRKKSSKLRAAGDDGADANAGDSEDYILDSGNDADTVMTSRPPLDFDPDGNRHFHNGRPGAGESAQQARQGRRSRRGIAESEEDRHPDRTHESDARAAAVAQRSIGSQRQLQQLGDGTRLLPKKRPTAMCQEAFIECSECHASLLCGENEEQAAHIDEATQHTFPSPRVNALVFRMAYSPALPLGPYVLALAALSMPAADQGAVVVFGCYPSLIAAALLAAKGQSDRVIVVSSARGCDAMRSRARGGLRSAVPDASVVIKTDPARFVFTASHVAILTTVRMANTFAAKLNTVEPGAMVAVAGTSVAAEPLRVKLPMLVPHWRLHSGPGLTVFGRPETDHNHRHDVVD